MTPARKRKWILSAGLLLWLIFLIQHIPVLMGREIASLDYFSRLGKPHDLAESDIVMVSVSSEDYASQKVFKTPDRLDPARVARAINIIASADPAVIAIDLDTGSVEYPDLCNAASKARPSTVPLVWAREARSPGEIPGSHRPFQPEKPVIPGPILGGMDAPPPPCTAGISNLFEDAGSVRRYEWQYTTKDGTPVDSFSLAVLRALCDAPASARIRRHVCGADQLPDKCDRSRDSCLRPAFIRFSMGSQQPNFSFADLFQLSSPKNSTDWKDAFQGKIVFVGAEFPQAPDRYPSVAGPLYSVRIHAEALAAALRNELIWVSPRWIVGLCELAALGVLYWAQRRIHRPAWRVVSILSGSLLLSVLLSWIAFRDCWFALSFVPVLCGVFLDVVGDSIKSADDAYVARAG